jgi:cytochrome P450
MLSARDDVGRPFSDDVIFGNLMGMLLAGEDTTAYALGWAVHQLCDSPESVMT